MSSSVDRILAAFSKLPPVAGVSFHGGDDDAAGEGGTLAGVLATSRSPRVASENFSTSVLYCLVTVSGRDLTQLSRHEVEQEIVLLPGTTLLGLGSIQAEGLRLVMLEELDVEREPSEARTSGDALDQLFATVSAAVATARAEPPVPVTSPGKFVAPIPFLS